MRLGRVASGIFALTVALPAAHAAAAAPSTPDISPQLQRSWMDFAVVLKPGARVDLLVDGPHHLRLGPSGTTAGEIAPDAGRAPVETYGQLDMRWPPTPAHSLEFALFVDEHGGSRLRLVNQAGEPVIYAAIIEYASGGRLVSEHTTICSVSSGGGAYEMWVQPVTEIRIIGVYAAPQHPVCGYADSGRLEAPPSTPLPPVTYSN